MEGVGLMFVSCCLFVHLGLGKAICRFLRVKLVLLRCVKCFTFWVMLAYTLAFTDLRWESCLALSFMLAYLALWVDLALNKIAKLYEEYNQED